MHTDFSPEDEAFRRELRAFLADRLPEDWVGIGHGGDAVETSFALTREMAGRGWLTQAWPAAYGGRDADLFRQTVFQEELWAHHEPRGGQYMGVNWIGPALMRFGTDSQRRTYLPEIAAGQVQWAQLFSEPDAGSDLAAVSVRAVRRDDGWHVDGEKIWTSFAAFARRGFLLARSEPGSRRKQGLSVLLVDLDDPGIEIRPIRTPLGEHKFHSVVFTDAVVPHDALLGGEGDGWAVAMAAVAFERVGAARYARGTRMLNKAARAATAGEGPDLRRVARLLARGRAAELMNHRVVAAREAGRTPTWEGSAARLHNTWYEAAVAAYVEEALGLATLPAAGDELAVEGGALEEYVRQTPSGAVASGTYEVQLGIVARSALGLPQAG